MNEENKELWTEKEINILNKIFFNEIELHKIKK